MDRASSEREGAIGGWVGRLLVLLVALTAFGASIVLSHRHDAAATQASDRYVCPMHPQIVARVPGDCPICNMALERVRDVNQERTPTTPRAITEEAKRRIITQVVRAPGWLAPGGAITAVVYKEVADKFAPGEQAVFFRSAQPAKAIPVRWNAEPARPWDASTVQVEFTSDPSPSSSSEEDEGWIELAARPLELLVVPVSSVLYSSAGAYVLAAAPGGHSFTRRHIEVGRNLDSGYVAEIAAERTGAVVVLSGLSEGERVVTRDTFLLDAERRLQGAQDNANEVME